MKTSVRRLVGAALAVLVVVAVLAVIGKNRRRARIGEPSVAVAGNALVPPSARVPHGTSAEIEQRVARRTGSSGLARTSGTFFHILLSRSLIGLTDEQIVTVGVLMQELSDRRLALERARAVAKQTGPHEVQIEIDPYPQEGARIKREFYSSLRRELGETLAGKIEASFARSIEVENEYFGTQAQEFRVTAAEGGRYDIEHRSYSVDNPTAWSAIHDSVTTADPFNYRILIELFPPPQ